jgi:hypothetical protein
MLPFIYNRVKPISFSGFKKVAASCTPGHLRMHQYINVYYIIRRPGKTRPVAGGDERAVPCLGLGHGIPLDSFQHPGYPVSNEAAKSL